MDSAVVAAWIGAGIALAVALVSVCVTVWSANHQRAIDLVVAALSHMGGGTQERSAGVAALAALRGPHNHPPGYFSRRGWRTYGPAVGQQLYRQLMYVLNHGKERYASHEVENVLAMIEWLLDDAVLLGFEDPAQRHRLAVSLTNYVAAVPAGSSDGEPGPSPEPANTPLAALRRHSSGWLGRLEPGKAASSDER